MYLPGKTSSMHSSVVWTMATKPWLSCVATFGDKPKCQQQDKPPTFTSTECHACNLSLLALTIPQSFNNQSTAKSLNRPSQFDAAHAWMLRTYQVLLCMLCSKTAAGQAFRQLNIPKSQWRWTCKNAQRSGEPKVFLPWGDESMRHDPSQQMVLPTI